jgi:hypothetical protein
LAGWLSIQSAPTAGFAKEINIDLWASSQWSRPVIWKFGGPEMGQIWDKFVQKCKTPTPSGRLLKPSA